MVYTWFRRVCTCLYKYKLVYTRFNFYKHVHTMYIHVCTANVLCTEGYIHFMKCTDIVEHGTYTVQTLLNRVRTLLYLFDSAFLFALLAGLLAGPGCCQASRLFNLKFKQTSLIGIRLGHSCPYAPSREGWRPPPPAPRRCRRPPQRGLRRRWLAAGRRRRAAGRRRRPGRQRRPRCRRCPLGPQTCA